jgi:hypothetical protein
MPHTARRRLALLVAAALATSLAACTNPVAPTAPDAAKTPVERPSAGVYMGSAG